MAPGRAARRREPASTRRTAQVRPSAPRQGIGCSCRARAGPGRRSGETREPGAGCSTEPPEPGAVVPRKRAVSSRQCGVAAAREGRQEHTPSSRSGQRLCRTCWKGARLRLRVERWPLPSSAGCAAAQRGHGDPRGQVWFPVLPPTLQADLFLKNDAFGQPRGTSEGEVGTGGGSRALTRKDPEAACVLVAVMGCPARWPASARVFLGKEASSCQSSRRSSRAWERPAHPPSADGGPAPPGIRRGPVPVCPALLDGCWQLTGGSRFKAQLAVPVDARANASSASS